jgi:large-conductance mechanosensitive channel
MLRSLKDNITAMVDLGVVLMIGIAFAGLMVGAYIIWTLVNQLTIGSAIGDATMQANATSSIANVTSGFDNAVNLILVAITIFILAIAISALLMLRGR